MTLRWVRERLVECTYLEENIKEGTEDLKPSKDVTEQIEWRVISLWTSWHIKKTSRNTYSPAAGHRHCGRIQEEEEKVEARRERSLKTLGGRPGPKDVADTLG